ncbi:MAG: hypothetical protein RL264_882 [Bacteroidota bacterium]|jgi:ATP-binding protein involved in chromosome partitioning
MELNRENVLEVLGNIIEPDLKKDIVSLNLVERLEVAETEVELTVAISNPALHARKRMQEAIDFNLKRFFGNDIKVSTLVKGMEKEARSSHRKVLPDIKHIVAIASGKGGVGKSTVTANIAGGLVKKGYKVGIVDADIYGPSMPTMFSVVDERPTMTEKEGKNLIVPVESKGIKLLSIGFFTDPNNAVVWRGPMASKALTQLFLDADWGELDFLLVDLPPGTGDIHLSLVQTVPLDGVVIVSTPQEVALADARRGVQMFSMDSLKVPIIGIVENMAWFTPAELPENKYYIFGRDGARNLASGLNVPFLGAIPLVQSVREAGDIGNPAVYQENGIASAYFTDLVDTFVSNLELIAAERNKK